MKSVYNQLWLQNLELVKDAKQWLKSGFISKEQYTAISETYKSQFYHPNFTIRILLFIATLVAISGVTGMLTLMVSSAGEDALAVIVLLYGFTAFFILDRIFIANYNHYKSGVTEAILYYACGLTIGGASWVADFDSLVVNLACIIILSFAAYRYLDILCTIGACLSVSYLIFDECYEMGSAAQQSMPIVFIIIFTPVALYVRRLKKKEPAELWYNCLTAIEVLSLITIYAAGNYLVVRELSTELMNLDLVEGENIPLAFVFYVLTVIIPILYLYLGIKKKDLVLLRVSLIVLAFSVFTFKYYYSLGYHEITLVVSGMILITIALALFKYLKTFKNGYTANELLLEKWAGANPQAFIISQTLGDNRVTVDESFNGGGGGFGGGGASGSY
ncbi:hypothetical protein [Chryseosolibacter indicus]|uniref:DUF2157 domain-containing protein n=1 Tax=Chryseosolibacter indicus TaxID=2782351 RepID=A0ABS5VWD9_9BACT|nr:hypothetical protein [Chryseosolibacter indicus]MBT1705049.1 hypothetical protein [Chryseosolibacter indicus]